jgi:EAL domain-containing protein (putative c-di-GMP-specific phosphodiesterase class I)
METSQQEPRAVVGNPKPNPAFFSIEIESSVFQKLTNLATKEQLPINQLVSEILKAFLTAHHRELKSLIETLKKRSRRE